MVNRWRQGLTARSTALVALIDNGLEKILCWWLAIAVIASIARLVMTPHATAVAAAQTFASYMLLAIAPVASAVLAMRWFSDGHLQPQPTTRMALYGRWTRLSRADAERHSLYGTGGMLVSLLVGIMLNVPVRTAEYLAATPPLPARAPHWLLTLHLAMTMDAVIFSSLYMVAFVAALRRVPLFPRLLVAIWLSDLSMQLITADLVSAAGPPANIATALNALLVGNVKKVLISMAVWLPYLLLSTRVNITYRHRVPAPRGGDRLARIAE